MRVVLYDGVCNVCNAFVGFVLERDSRREVFFLPLSSRAAGRLLRHFGLPAALDSIVVIDRAEDVVRLLQSASPSAPLPPSSAACAYIRSTAVLTAVAGLGWPWSLSCLLLLVPQPLRDAAYRAFASVRYAAFGRSEEEQCRLPSKDWRRQMLQPRDEQSSSSSSGSKLEKSTASH